MTPREEFIAVWDMEFNTTVKVLKAYPQDKSDLKPHEKLKTAKDLAWNFVVEEQLIGAALDGKIDFTAIPAAPATMQEVIDGYIAGHNALVEKAKSAPDAAYETAIDFMTGPNQFGKVPVQQLLWMMVMDKIHHRGQFSVYLRMAGGKVPSIYGPTADEPWM